MSHTPEPWASIFHKTVTGKPFGLIVGGRSKAGLMDTVICHSPDFRDEPISFKAFEAGDARRIVACVNACEGSSTEWLEFQTSADRVEQFGPPEPFETRYTKELQKGIQCMEQRDELLQALQDLLVLYQRKRPGLWGASLDQVKAAKAAIQKVTGAA